MAINLGYTADLFQRVKTAYPKPRAGEAGPPGFVASNFAKFLGVNASDVTRWEDGAREAGAYLPAQMARYLTLTFGDSEKAARVVYAEDLAAIGHGVQPLARSDAEAHEAVCAAQAHMGGLLAGFATMMAADSDGGVRITNREVPELLPHARALRARLDDLISGAEANQGRLPFVVRDAAGGGAR